MKRPMPVYVYMLFAYFAGVFASVNKNHWWDWLLPLLPLGCLIPLNLVWTYNPKFEVQKKVKDYE